MAWTQTANIRGASGPPGATGPTGPTGPTGASGASGGTGGTGGPGTTSWAQITDKPGAILNYKGTWNASTNSPTLSDATGSGGDVYRVSVGASRNLGSGSISWDVGDYAIWSPVTSSWEKADTTDAVSSVAGRTGAVTLTSADLGASGSASSSTFLRGDNSWAVPSDTGITRSVLTITSPTTLASSNNTDYVYFLSTADPYYANMVALLYGNGSNNSTTITDSSPLAANWTATGNAKLNTTTKKYGTASISLDGTNSYITASAASSNFAFGSSDFTIEFWIYINNNTAQAYFDFRPSSTNGAYPTFTNDNGVFNFFVSSANRISGTTSIQTATWYHVAVCRSGTSTRLFVNGTQEGSTYSDSNNYLCGSSRPVLGTNGAAIGASYLNAFIDDLRITRAARYTANFTAPTAEPTIAVGTPTLPTASSNTNLYTLRNLSTTSITVSTTSSQQIDGATGGLAVAANTTARLISDGTGWRSV